MVDPLRPVDAVHLLGQARAVAATRGVTRLADVTRLDRIGMPVWQAIRPMSRSLSVHQGRGRTHAEAELGAMMEAIESDSAERFDDVALTSSWNGLPGELRAGRLDDFARDRGAKPSPDQPMSWSLADCLDGRSIAVPTTGVSLDFTRFGEQAIERSSNGLAAGFSADAARLASLMELIERDAVATWRLSDMTIRMADTIDLSRVEFGWFKEWHGRLKEVGAHLQCYHVPSISGTPVIAAEISDQSKPGVAYRAMEGTGAHPSVEVALLRAVSEAIQCRCAYIAGARDDIHPDDFATSGDSVRVVFGLPLPPGWRGRGLDEVRDGSADVEQLCTAINDQGVGPVAFVPVSDRGDIFVTKAFAPGLGYFNRTRRVS